MTELPLVRGGTNAPEEEWEERQKQKKFLRDFYPDYDPVHHDAFVLMFNNGIEAARLNEYEKSRGIVDLPEIKPGDLVRFTPYCKEPLIQEGIVGEVITGSTGEIGYHIGLKDDGGVVRIWPSQGKIELLALPNGPIGGKKNPDPRCTFPYSEKTSDACAEYAQFSRGEITREELEGFCVGLVCKCWTPNKEKIGLELAIREIETQPEIEPIPENFARSAFSWNSMDPEKRARLVVREYEETLREDWRNLFGHAKDEGQIKLLQEEFSRYAAGYRVRYMKWLSSLSRCASAFVTGPSKFPTRKMEKRNDIEGRRSVEIGEYRSRALDAIEKALHPELRPIMSGDSDACARLREKIAKAEEKQEKMRAVNKCVKRKKGGPDLEGLRTLGLSEEAIKSAIAGDCFGNKGVPPYELSNNNANIRRMKQRLEKITRDQAAEITSLEGELANLEDCPAENRIRLFFGGIPSVEVREKLKRNGFRWTPSLGCWQAYRNCNSAQVAKEIAGIREEEGK